MLETICRYPTFAPERYDWAEPIRSHFDPHDLSGPIGILINEEGNRLTPQDPRGSILLTRKHKPRCFFNVSWSGIRLHPIDVSSYSLDEQYTRKPNQLQEWLDFSLSLFIEQDAWYGTVALDEEYTRKHQIIFTVPANSPADLPPGATIEVYLGNKLYKNIPGVYWGTYFGPFYIEWLGRHRFDNLPYVRKEWLPNGSIFITTAALPSEWQNPEVQTLQRQLGNHLAADAFFDIDEVRAVFAQQLGKNNVFDPNQVLPHYRLPNFPFTQTYNARLAEVTLNQRHAIIEDQRKLGFEFVEENPSGILFFQDKKADRVAIDPTRCTLTYFPKL